MALVFASGLSISHSRLSFEVSNNHGGRAEGTVQQCTDALAYHFHFVEILSFFSPKLFSARVTLSAGVGNLLEEDARQTKVLVHVCPLLYDRFARLVRGGLLPLLGRLRGFPAGGWSPYKRACSARAVDTADGAEFGWKEGAVVEVEAAIAGAAVPAVVVDAAGEERAIRSAVWIRRSAHSRRIFWVVGSIRNWSEFAMTWVPWHKVRTGAKMWPSDMTPVEWRHNGLATRPCVSNNAWSKEFNSKCAYSI